MSDADVENVKLGDRVTANMGTNVDAFISGRVVDRADVDGGTFLVVETDPVGVVYVPPGKVVDVQDGADDPETVEDAVQILRHVLDGRYVSGQRFDWAMERVIAFVEQNIHADEPEGDEPSAILPKYVVDAILAARDALVEGDVNEAYHHLYQLAKIYAEDPFKPWAKLEDWQDSYSQPTDEPVSREDDQ